MEGNKLTIARINRVLDYIDKHKGDSLTLNELAEVAHLSPYHFHRIFSATMGESLGKYVQRIRLNWAAGILMTHPEYPVTRIALDTGFSSSAAFAYAFKQQWGMSASDWRKCSASGEYLNQALRKNSNIHSNPSIEWEVKTEVISSVPFTQRWRITMKPLSNTTANVILRTIAPVPLVYIRNIGQDKGDETVYEGLFSRLCQWAASRDLIKPDAMVLSIYHDLPEVVEEDKFRTSCCISVPEGTTGEGEIGTMTLQGGKYAVAHFEIDADQYPAAWQALYAGWLPESGYACDDRPAFERYLNDPNNHPEGKHEIEIWLPVKPA